MKYLVSIILITYQCSFCFGQISISGKVIPWKNLDNLDSLRVSIHSIKSEIFTSTIPVDKFKHIDGEYPRKIFDIDIDITERNLKFEVSYKYKKQLGRTSDGFSKLEVINVPISYREERIELEIHFQKYSTERRRITEGGKGNNYSSKEQISKLVVKKIYKLPEGIQLIRSWEPLLSNTPKYFIQNNSKYKLYGQSEDGKFEGILYKNENNTLNQIYTGGYNYDYEPSKQLYSNNYSLSYIRDHRETDNKYKLISEGEYLYKVYLGFLPYESSDRFGKTPTFSVNKERCFDYGEKYRIYEYFELVDKFEIE